MKSQVATKTVETTVVNDVKTVEAVPEATVTKVESTVTEVATAVKADVDKAL